MFCTGELAIKPNDAMGKPLMLDATFHRTVLKLLSPELFDCASYLVCYIEVCGRVHGRHSSTVHAERLTPIIRGAHLLQGTINGRRKLYCAPVAPAGSNANQFNISLPTVRRLGLQSVSEAGVTQTTLTAVVTSERCYVLDE